MEMGTRERNGAEGERTWLGGEKGRRVDGWEGESEGEEERGRVQLGERRRRRARGQSDETSGTHQFRESVRTRGREVSDGMIVRVAFGFESSSPFGGGGDVGGGEVAVEGNDSGFGKKDEIKER